MGEITDPFLTRAGEPDKELATAEDYAERRKWWASPEGQAELLYQKENPVNGPMTLDEHEYAERVKYWNSPEGQAKSARIRAACALVEPQGYEERAKYWNSPEGQAQSERIMAEETLFDAKSGN